MAVIYHDQGIVSVREITYPGEVCDDSVHGEDTVSCDQFDPCAVFICLFQLCFKILHVIVLIAVSLCFAEPDAVNDGSVVELVADHRVLRGQDRLEEAAVCVEAGGVQNGVVRSEEFGYALLELFMDILGSADKPYGRHTKPFLVIGSLGSFDQPRAVAESEIIICAHTEQFPAVFHGDMSTLG